MRKTLTTTCVFQSYKAATVELREGQKLLDEVAQDIENMMLLKISAVKVSGGGSSRTSQNLTPQSA